MTNLSKERDEQYAQHWIERIRKANQYFDKWEKKFKCRILQRYIEGLQDRAEAGYSYYLNFFYSSIKVKKPSLLFARPTFSLTPKPWKLDWNPEIAMTVARLKEDTLNSFIQDSAAKFAAEIDMAIVDSWSYFGMIEVGYSANWIKNPNAGKPVLKGDYYDLDSEDKPSDVLTEPEEIPEKEFVYFKRIPAHRFRVGGADSHDMERCNWVGYYEFVRTEDLVANKKNLKNVDEKDWPGDRSDDFYFEAEGAEKESDFTTKGDFTKIWKIWDLRSKVFSILLANPEKCIFKETFERLPLFGLRFDLRRTGWYPVPVTFNWKSPQDEINESHSQMRNHRRRARQMFQVMEGMVDEDEKQKFINSPDSTMITVRRDQAIQPINNSPLDSAITTSLQISPDDFDKISGTSNNQRGVSDRGTASEANIVETRTQIREEEDRIRVAEWLCAIGREVLLTIIERFSEPFWIKLSKDEGDVGEEIQDLTAKYRLIHTAMINDETNFDLNISVTSLSPVTNEIEKKKFFEFISIVQNFPVLSLHPTLIREAAYRCDYRNEQVIRAVQKMAQLSMIGKIEEGKQNLSQGPEQVQDGQNSNFAQATVAQNTPPAQEEVRQQIENQQIQ